MELNTKKIDRTKCYSPSEYAKAFKTPLSTVYYNIHQGVYTIVRISGVRFIYVA